MLANINTTINANAVSAIGTAENQKVVCNFSGYIDGTLQPNTSRVIRDLALYTANKEQCDQDFEDFTEYVIGLIKTE